MLLEDSPSIEQSLPPLILSSTYLIVVLVVIFKRPNKSLKKIKQATQHNFLSNCNCCWKDVRSFKRPKATKTTGSVVDMQLLARTNTHLHWHVSQMHQLWTLNLLTVTIKPQCPRKEVYDWPILPTRYRIYK